MPGTILAPTRELQEEILELTRYMDTLGGDMTRQITPLLEAGNTAGAFTLLSQKTSNLFSGASEKDLDGSFNLLLSVFRHAEPAQFRELMLEMLKQLEAYEGARDLASLKIMSNIFNMVDLKDPLRLDAFMAIVRAASKRNRMSLIVPQLQFVSEWADAWNISAEQRRSLFKLLKDEFSRHRADEAFVKALVKYLEAVGTDEALKGEVVASLLQFLRTPSVFTLQGVVSLPAVAALKGHWMHGLLSVFETGTLSDYDKLYASLPAGTLTDADHQLLRRKMRLLTLAALAADHLNGEVPWSEIAAALQTPLEEVETVVIEAIQFKLLDAKVDQTKQVVIVSRTTYRKFGEPEWAQLRQRLGEWSQSVTQVLDVVRNARLISNNAM